MARPNMPTRVKERTNANTGARIMGFVPSMKGKAKETALWMSDMDLGGSLLWPAVKETYAQPFKLQ